MQIKPFVRWLFLLSLMFGSLNPAWHAAAAPPQARQYSAALAQSSGVTAFDLIIAMNTLRMSNGLPALVEDPIIDAVAQSTAEIMAANQMSSHIGDVRGRLASAGYGGGATVWATENFAVGGSYAIDEIMQVWSDAAHSIPAVNPAYCNVGAGIAKSSSGQTYYVLQAAYTSSKSCGEYKSPGGTTVKPGGSTGVSQVIVAVKIANPDADGRRYHVVQPGQSFWAIAIAYKITIKDLEVWNNISRDSKLQIGQRLFIPDSGTAGYATPTPVGMIQISTPDADGRVIHSVQSYQTLTTIAQAYTVNIQTLLTLNGIQVDWPLQIGQKLVINPGAITPSPTPRPLTPIEKLTPASDGKYYHTVRSGETLFWIAQQYEVGLTNLMAWNGLSGSSILQPEQKILLQVTPPITATASPGPATVTPTPTSAPATPTASPSQTQAVIRPTGAVETPAAPRSTGGLWVAFIGLVLVVVVVFWQRKR